MAEQNLGHLPFKEINRTLGFDLDEGVVVITKKAIEHIRGRHAADAEFVLSNIATVIQSPMYVGQAPDHSEGFELVRRIVSKDGSRTILVAINLKKNKYQNYFVRSAYILKEDVVSRRVSKRHLLNIIK